MLDIEEIRNFLSKQWNNEPKGRKSVTQWSERQKVKYNSILMKGRASSAVTETSLQRNYSFSLKCKERSMIEELKASG